MQGPQRLFSALRVEECLLMLGFPLVGALFSAATSFQRLYDFQAMSSLLTLCSVLLLLALGIYALNSWSGYGSDLVNPRLQELSMLSQKTHLLLSIILLLIGLLLLKLFGPVQLLLGSSGVILWILYSLPERGLKNTVVGGTAVHFLSQIIQFHMGYILFAPASQSSLLISFYFSLLFCAGHLHHQAIDHGADVIASLRTAGVHIGVRKALQLSTALFLFSTLYWFVLSTRVQLPSTAFWTFLGAGILESYFAVRLLSTEVTPVKLLLQQRYYRVCYGVAGLVFAVSLL